MVFYRFYSVLKAELRICKWNIKFMYMESWKLIVPQLKIALKREHWIQKKFLYKYFVYVIFVYLCYKNFDQLCTWLKLKLSVSIIDDKQ